MLQRIGLATRKVECAHLLLPVQDYNACVVLSLKAQTGITIHVVPLHRTSGRRIGTGIGSDINTHAYRYTAAVRR